MQPRSFTLPLFCATLLGLLTVISGQSVNAQQSQPHATFSGACEYVANWQFTGDFTATGTTGDHSQINTNEYDYAFCNADRAGIIYLPADATSVEVYYVSSNAVLVESPKSASGAVPGFSLPGTSARTSYAATTTGMLKNAATDEVYYSRTVSGVNYTNPFNCNNYLECANWEKPRQVVLTNPPRTDLGNITLKYEVTSTGPWTEFNCDANVLGICTQLNDASLGDRTINTGQILINIRKTPVQVVTPPPPPSIPAPEPFTVNAQATCLSTTTVGIAFDWTASNGAQNYTLTAISGGPTVLAQTGALTYQYAEPATAWATRQYELVATGPGGSTQASLGTGATSSSPGFSLTMPNCVPPAPGALTATLTTSCNGSNPIGRLEWTAATGASSYRIYDTGTPGDTQLVATLPASANRSFNTPLSRTNPSFSIEASNDGGVSSTSVSATLPDCAPQASISLGAVNAICSVSTPNNILTWTSSDGSAGSLGSFDILRNGTSIGTTTSNTFADTSAVSGTTYTYTIQSGSTTSNAQSVTTINCPQAPDPTTLTVAGLCTGTTPVNQLNWTTSTNALRYRIDRNGQPLVTVDAPTTSYADSAITSSSSYTYLVHAINDVGVEDSTSQQGTALNCAPATVNRPPVANDDSASTGPATTVNVAVLTNDSDPDGNLDPNTLRITQQPTNGTATVASPQAVVYTPNTGFSGTDVLTYEVCDTTALCDTALVAINVNPAPPVVEPPVVPGAPTLAVQALCVGSLPQHALTWSASSDALRYVVLRDNQSLGTVVATSFIDTTAVTGTTFAYVIEAQNDDGSTRSNELTHTTASCATPTAANQPPVASDDTATTPQGSPVTIGVLTNDVDPDGQINPSCTVAITQPTNGTTSVDPNNGRITYTPTASFSGTDSFVYEMCDEDGLTDTAAVSIVVQAPAPAPTATNQPPQANDDAGTTTHNQPTTIDILGNDIDPDNNLDRTCAKVTRQPGHGTVVLDTAAGRATYTPTNGFAGTDTFEYSICDTAGLTDTATVTIAVGQAPPNALVSTGIPIFGFFVDLWNRFLALIGLR